MLQIGPFVYLYHLAIFLFCAGYLFKEIDDYWGFIAKKLKGLYRPYVVYSLAYLLFRNIFIEMGIISAEKYTGDEIIAALSNAISFHYNGELLGALWFLPMMFLAVALYGIVIYATQRLADEKLKNAVRVLLCCILGGIGLYVTDRQLRLPNSIHISLLMVPVILLGHYFKKINGKRFLNIAGLLACFAMMIGVIRSGMGIIELSACLIINKAVFYPVTICGIYFCLSLSDLLMKINAVQKGLAYVGKSSLHIMALHFLGFKLADFFLCRATGKIELLNAFPHSFEGVWPIYCVAGIALPLGIRVLADHMRIAGEGWKITRLTKNNDRKKSC